MNDSIWANPEVVRGLFVEDAPAVAQMYKPMLELDRYRVEVAGDGEVALKMARTSLPDIILLGIRLPKVDGLEVLEALCADPQTRTVPVVILASHSEEELVERGARLGLLDHLIKSRTTPAQLADASRGGLKTSSAGPAPIPDTPRRGPPSVLASLPQADHAYRSRI